MRTRQKEKFTAYYAVKGSFYSENCELQNLFGSSGPVIEIQKEFKNELLIEARNQALEYTLDVFDILLKKKSCFFAFHHKAVKDLSEYFDNKPLPDKSIILGIDMILVYYEDENVFEKPIYGIGAKSGIEKRLEFLDNLIFEDKLYKDWNFDTYYYRVKQLVCIGGYDEEELGLLYTPLFFFENEKEVGYNALVNLGDVSESCLIYDICRYNQIALSRKKKAAKYLRRKLIPILKAYKIHLNFENDEDVFNDLLSGKHLYNTTEETKNNLINLINKYKNESDIEIESNEQIAKFFSQLLRFRIMFFTHQDYLKPNEWIFDQSLYSAANCLKHLFPKYFDNLVSLDKLIIHMLNSEVKSVRKIIMRYKFGYTIKLL